MIKITPTKVFGLGVMSLMAPNWPLAFFLYSALRAVLFLWAGSMILQFALLKSLRGRNLVGWGLMLWWIYVTLFPLMIHWPSAFPLAFGFLVGFHVLSILGMPVLLLDGMRVRAETIEKHARRLEGLLPICSHCKKIRDDQNG